MPEKGQIIAVGQAVTYQLHEGDTECNQGKGTIKDMACGGKFAVIEPDPGQGTNLDEIYRTVSGNQLIIDRP